MKKVVCVAAALIVCSCLFSQGKNRDWINQGNIYEVNVRQYTPEGTFKAFQKHLPRLKKMGVQTLWFMPINPISKVDRKGVLGSYYAISNYTAINPEFGTMNDWKALVSDAHKLGFKVIIDWVANHTGADNYWMEKHPDFFVKDSTGNFVYAFDWSDTRDLNYDNEVLQDTMINAMKYWVTNTGIDGFRCDVAAEVPEKFWTKAIKKLRKVKNVFMLAESNEPWMYKAGFDVTYAWTEFHTMKEVAKGKSARSIDSIMWKYDKDFPKLAKKLYFTSNHDENSWNKADYETMPGAVHTPFAVLTQTIKNSVPLIYSGQEEPYLDSLSFFYKDLITFDKYKRAAFYKVLLDLRKSNKALSSQGAFRKLKTNNDDALYCFERTFNTQKVLVVLNLSDEAQTIKWTDKPSEKIWWNVFYKKFQSVDKGFSIKPWGFGVFEIK